VMNRIMHGKRTAEFIMVNNNKDLWRIDYESGMAEHTRQGITIDGTEKEDNNNEYSGKAGVAGYNGDITQYLEEKGYTWEQLGEDSLKFWYDKEHQ
jgi:hypothetical protein